MSTIAIECLDQTLTIVNAPLISSGDIETDKAQFTFCPMWNGFTKTAIFYRNEEESYAVTLVGNGVYEECTIPKEVLQSEGCFYFGVHGVKDNKVKTSQVMRYRVVKGAITETTTIPDPTPDIYTQILTAINEAGGVTVKESGFHYEMTDVGYNTGIMYQTTDVNYPYTGG